MNAQTHAAPRGLYLLTPDIPETAQLLAQVAAVLPHATWLQYRNKRAGRDLRRAQIRALLPLCQATGVPLIVNDDWMLAAELGADGAHLGEDDGALSEARRALGPDAIVGASCYDALELAQRAVDAGASYVAFGAFFPSPTKPDARVAHKSLLREAVALGVPRVAIGGITPENARQLAAAGADLVAVISGVFASRHPAAAAHGYRAAFGL